MVIFTYLVYSGLVGPTTNSRQLLSFPLGLFGIIPALFSIYNYKTKLVADQILIKMKTGTPVAANKQLENLFNQLSDDEKKLSSFFPHFQGTQIQCLALNEWIVIIALISNMSEGTPLSYFNISLAVALMLNIYMFPKFDELLKEVERKLRLKSV
jgi:hypothetical protein